MNINQDCSAWHRQPAREIAKTEISPFYITRQIQPTTYILSVSKEKIKLLVSFDKQEVITWTPASSPDSQRQDAILLDVHISSMSPRPLGNTS